MQERTETYKSNSVDMTLEDYVFADAVEDLTLEDYIIIVGVILEAVLGGLFFLRLFVFLIFFVKESLDC